jgi:prepilin-type N-terminal cleavage/methylation domain-containing protein
MNLPASIPAVRSARPLSAARRSPSLNWSAGLRPGAVVAPRGPAAGPEAGAPPVSWLQPGGDREGQPGRTALRGRAFTLIEMLVVMAIIAVLASITMVGFGTIKKKMRISRVQAELARLETAIENYKQSLGFYPPDNALPRPANSQMDLSAPWHAAAPLFYELSGTVINGPNYQTVEGNETVSTNLIQQYFGRAGFANASADKTQVKNFLPTLKDTGYKEAFVGVDVELLVAPVDGPGLLPIPGGNAWRSEPSRPNPWRYVATKPVHRPGEFDLWVDIVIGSSANSPMYRISNWAEPVQVKP